MAEGNPKPSTILVVDDSTFLRKRIREALQGGDYVLVEAGNGRSALDALDTQEFACVLTDLVMPDLDGFGLLAEVQKRHLDIPVIVLTADIQKTTRDRCHELGASGFLQKPVNPSELRTTLSNVLGGRN